MRCRTSGRWRRLWVAATLLPGLLTTGATAAASGSGAWLIDRWSIDQGLPNHALTDLLQTEDGYLWIATWAGISRFDGVRFTPLPVSLPNNHARVLDTAFTQPFGPGYVVESDVDVYARWTPVRVPYVFTGFLAPVENLPVLNVGQSGRTIPLKWRLARPDGTPVTALGSFVSLMESAVACDASPDNVLEEQLAESVGGGIRYDAAADLFIFNWKTRKGVTGCRLVTVTLDDGSRHVARFRLR